MTHLKNIAALFNKNFVESPLIETFEAGKIRLTTGRIVACDPLITNDMAAFKINFPQLIDFVQNNLPEVPVVTSEKINMSHLFFRGF